MTEKNRNIIGKIENEIKRLNKIIDERYGNNKWNNAGRDYLESEIKKLTSAIKKISTKTYDYLSYEEAIACCS